MLNAPLRLILRVREAELIFVKVCQEQRLERCPGIQMISKLIESTFLS